MVRPALLAVFLAVPLAPADAQRPHAWQVHGLAAVADATFVGGGVGGAVRIARRMELAATLTAGAIDEQVAGRGEVLAVFLLNPFQRRGVALYGGGGVAVTGTEDALDERMVVLLGMRRAGAARAGWFLEAGAGGGVRLAAGVRLQYGGAAP